MSAEVKPGYKQTELGVIPEDWDVRPLGQLVHAVEYGSSAKSSSSGKIPVLRMGNLQEGKIDWSDLVFTDNESEIAKYLLNPGDVLFNRTNTIDLVGKAAIYKGTRPSIFAGYLIRIKEKKDQIDSRYLNYFLNSKFAKNYGLKVLSVAVGQANINGQKLKTYPVALPPTVDEQISIATAVSEMEEFISSLEQMIAKKRDIQQAVMQQLLTGQRRLPGFSGEWEVKRLGDVVEIKKGQLITEKLASPGDIPVVAGGKKPAYFHSAANRSGKNITISASGASAGYVAFFETPIFASDCSTIGESDKYEILFVYYFLKSRQEDIYKAQTGGAQPHIHPADIYPLVVTWPDKAEQTAIATILSDMDSERAMLEARRDKAKQLKVGMMQQLLSGSLRII